MRRHDEADRDLEILESHETDVLSAFEDELPGAAPAESFLARSLRQYIPALVAFVLVLVLWESVTRFFEVKSFILPRPSAIFQSLIDEFSTIVPAARRTLLEALGGFFLGGSLGILLALATVRWSAMRDGFLPFAVAANSVPIIALAPISNAMFGLTSLTSKVVVVAVVVFFPVMINTARGLIEVDAAEIELMRSFASSPRSLLWKVRIPSALPYLFSALKVASALSLIAAIVSEYFGGPSAVLGIYILNKSQQLNLTDAWAGIVVASVIGIVFYGVILVVERLVMPWHVSFRALEDR